MYSKVTKRKGVVGIAQNIGFMHSLGNAGKTSYDPYTERMMKVQQL